jgi:hypothetical protein
MTHRSSLLLSLCALLFSHAALAQPDEPPAPPRIILDRDGRYIDRQDTIPRFPPGFDPNAERHGWPLEAGGSCSHLKTASVPDASGKQVAQVYAWKCGDEKFWLATEMWAKPEFSSNPRKMLMELKRIEVIHGHGRDPSQYKAQGDALLSTF